MLSDLLPAGVIIKAPFGGACITMTIRKQYMSMLGRKGLATGWISMPKGPEKRFWSRGRDEDLGRQLESRDSRVPSLPSFVFDIRCHLVRRQDGSRSWPFDGSRPS